MKAKRDYSIGLRVHWHRCADVMTGYVSKVTYDQHRPAYVRCNGRTYKPHADDFCDEKGEPPRRFGGKLQDQVNQLAHARGAAALYGSEFVNVPAPLPRAFDQLGDVLFSEPGARCVPTKPPIRDEDLRGTFHEFVPLPGVFVAGCLTYRDEYASPRGAFKRRASPEEDVGLLRLARYALRNLHAKDPACGYDKMAAAVERAADCAQGIPHVRKSEPLKFDHGGWYTHGCGQWVHDKLAPCSVCRAPKEKRKKK